MYMYYIVPHSVCGKLGLYIVVHLDKQVQMR